jgi:hypothetical protein
MRINVFGMVISRWDFTRRDGLLVVSVSAGQSRSAADEASHCIAQAVLPNHGLAIILVRQDSETLLSAM